MHCFARAGISLSAAALLAAGTITGPLRAQDPQAVLEALHAMTLDSVPGVATVYFRPPDRERALELRSMLAEYLDYWNAQLGLQLHLRIAVLPPEDWQKITPLPYGFPNAVAPPANLIPAPATPPPASGFATLLIDGDRMRDWMLIGHEGGHLLELALLPPDVLTLLTTGSPGDTAFDSRVRWINALPQWFGEYAANYFATAFLLARHPDDGAAWVRYLEALAAPAPRRFSHLDDWFGQLMRATADDGSPYFLSAEGAPNFGWYQGVAGMLGTHVLAQRGDAVGHLRRVLSSDDVPTTAELVAGLEAIAPGAQALLDSLGAGYRSRDGEPRGGGPRTDGASLSARTPAVAIRRATVIDVTDGSLLPDRTVLVLGNRIAAVGPVAEVVVPADAQVIEASGAYVVPGLWDMHVHATNQQDVRSYLTLFIANGITGFREPWGARDVSDSVRAAIAAHRLAGPPRQVVAGALIDGPVPTWPGSLIALTPDDGRRLVDSLHAAGAPFLKLMESMPPAVYFAIAERARASGIPVAGHVPTAVAASAASDAGQRSIEHFSGIVRGCSTAEDAILTENLGATQAAMRGENVTPPPEVQAQRTLHMLATQDEGRCRDLAARFAHNETWQVPTLVPFRGYAWMRELAAAGDLRLRYLGPQFLSFWTPSTNPFASAWPEERWASLQAMYARLEALVPIMVTAGVPLLAGSDTPNPWVIPGFGLHDELELLVRAGLTPLHALQAATLNPARFFGRTDELGTIAAGRLADLLVLESNPLEDITATRRIRAVVADGRLYERAELDSMLEALAAWQVRPSVADAIRDVLDSHGLEAARVHSRALHAARADSLKFGDNELNLLARELLNGQRVPEAIAVLEMNVEVYPEAPNAWDGLGDGLVAAGRESDARAAYERAVMLAEQHNDPRITLFRRKLERLKPDE